MKATHFVFLCLWIFVTKVSTFHSAQAGLRHCHDQLAFLTDLLQRKGPIDPAKVQITFAIQIDTQVAEAKELMAVFGSAYSSLGVRVIQSHPRLLIVQAPFHLYKSVESLEGVGKITDLEYVESRQPSRPHSRKAYEVKLDNTSLEKDYRKQYERILQMIGGREYRDIRLDGDILFQDRKNGFLIVWETEQIAQLEKFSFVESVSILPDY